MRLAAKLIAGVGLSLLPASRTVNRIRSRAYPRTAGRDSPTANAQQHVRRYIATTAVGARTHG